MKGVFGAAVGRALDHRAAARHGRRAGRAGLSVDEAADTTYLVGLRHRMHREHAGITLRLDRQLTVIEACELDAEIELRVLRGRQETLVARARDAVRDRVDRYEELCATYGRSWQRAHRDRHFAHLGWRCPQAPHPEEVIRHER